MLALIPYFLLYVFAAAGEAPITSDSIKGDSYVANFDSPNVQGQVRFDTLHNSSISVHVDVSGLPDAGGPFMYHVHQLPVPADGNCSGTLEHLNPYNGSVSAIEWASKEAGDLSGKHGTVSGNSINATYVEPYLSSNPSDPAFFGNLSIVFHLADKTRIACANITKVESKSQNSSIPSATSTPSSGAGHRAVSVMSVLAVGAFAALF
ncbi:Superoxide dismutase copper/zinc binding domain-containing protein [[Candida] zeylanoides]